MTDTGRHFDGREMLMLHDSFRREFALMPGLVRGVATGDRERAQVVAEHVGYVSTILHHHHHGEDVDVWPLLAERCPAECAPLVEQMEGQHEEVARIGQAIDEGLRDWADAAEATREVLAAALVHLLPVLREHLAAEEELVVPLMEQYITAAEWNEIVEKEATWDVFVAWQRGKTAGPLRTLLDALIAKSGKSSLNSRHLESLSDQKA